MQAVKIGPQDPHGGLGFDLSQVLAALQPSDHLRWVLRDTQIIWPDDIVPARFDFHAGIDHLDAAGLDALADAVYQVIDGTFIGGSSDGTVDIAISAVDSSFWVVWAADPAQVDRLRLAFTVEDVDAPLPT